MTKKYYHALFDNQNNRITSIGINKTSKNTIKGHLIDFLLLGNFSEEGEDSVKNNTLSELLNYYEFKLLKSNSPFKT
ncbi:hypothetical protein L6279_01665 [Candidatus Parcubacteria bacterium]|nr:hypothetical protein [Patescibacteria group bacterium]MCG2692797.1 hypothetical protein [Candidatus Parcubacteria bacterium]